MPKFIVNLFLIIALVVIQVSLLPTLGFPTALLSPILSTVIFVTIVLSYQYGLWLALVMGFFLELHSIFNFGVVTFSLLTTVIFINFLFDHFFTNRSLYSVLTLGLTGILFHNIILVFLSYFFYLNKLNDFFIVLDYTYPRDLFWQIFLNLILLFIIFSIIKFISKQLKPYFIIK